MKVSHVLLRVAAMIIVTCTSIEAQPTPERKPDLSNKALITKATPSMSTNKEGGAAALRKMADEYYAWRNENYPVRSSDFGLHT